VRPSPEEYGLALARVASLRSEDPYHKVGAVLLREDNTVASVGYNGPPSGVEIDWSDRDARRFYVIHAEANALRFVRPGEATMLCTTMMPCEHCVLLLAAYGIKHVIFGDSLDERVYDVDAITALADRVGVQLGWLPETGS
jgi:dCMP deaminase